MLTLECVGVRCPPGDAAGTPALMSHCGERRRSATRPCGGLPLLSIGYDALVLRHHRSCYPSHDCSSSGDRTLTAAIIDPGGDFTPPAAGVRVGVTGQRSGSPHMTTPVARARQSSLPIIGPHREISLDRRLPQQGGHIRVPGRRAVHPDALAPYGETIDRRSDSAAWHCPNPHVVFHSPAAKRASSATLFAGSIGRTDFGGDRHLDRQHHPVLMADG
jgi:hypothetical protein